MFRLTRFLLIILITVSIQPVHADSESLSLTYSTYFGGTNEDDGYEIAEDTEGNIYVAGATRSSDFPTKDSFGMENPSNAGVRSAFVTKFSPTHELLFSVVFGGSGQDTSTGIAIKSNGDIVVVGITRSSDFITSPEAFNQTFGGQAPYASWDMCCGDAFISILSNDGSELKYSSYFGGSGLEADIGLALDKEDNIYLTGITSSSDLPVTNGSYQTQLAGGRDYFISKFNPNATDLVYSTYVGGTGNEYVKGGGTNGHNIFIASNNEVGIVGATESIDFPTTEDAYQTTISGNNDAFYTKLAANGTSLSYSTYFGGSTGEWAGSITANDDYVYIIGNTNSEDFPVTEDAYQSEFAGGPCGFDACGDMFFSMFSSNNELVYATYLGGINIEFPTDIAVNTNGNAAISGFTDSRNFPTMNANQQSYGGGKYDIFVVIINPNDMVYSSFFGGAGAGAFEISNGILVTSENEYYFTGFSQAYNFPVSDDAYDTSHNGGSDMILAQISVGESIINQSSTTSSESTPERPVSISIILPLFTLYTVTTIWKRKSKLEYNYCA